MNQPGALLRTCVLVPMKRFTEAKTRLRGRLDDEARSRLARAMFERVLDAARSCELVDATYVVTNGDDVARLASARGARILADPEPRLVSLGALVDWGLAELTRRGAHAAVVVMADLPRVMELDLRELCAALATHDLVATPDRHGRSTNALGLQLPFATATAFGDPNSYAQHVAQARTHGLRICELRNPRLAHDVDTAEDWLDELTDDPAPAL